MFIVRPEKGHPIIHEVAKERKSLDELGVTEMTNIVIFDSELQSEASPNKSEYYHIIGQRFEIPKEEYSDLLPKGSAGIALPQTSFYDKAASMPVSQSYYPTSQPQQSRKNDIPPEYANDPELWYAIQASLHGEDPIPMCPASLPQAPN